MKVTIDNIERTLLTDLKTLWEKQPTHRCLYLKLSQLQQDLHEYKELIYQTLHHFLEDETAQIYMCHDQDIFILTRTMTYKRANDFLKNISKNLDPCFKVDFTPNMYTLFEIGVDWSKLRTMCERKIEQIKNDQLEKERKAKDHEPLSSASIKDTVNTLNTELINSLSKRRAQREVPEIMVVEDDAFSQKLIENVLKGKYPTSMTADGRGALMIYVNKAPDVLFLDIGLPDINGHEVLEKLFKIDPDAYVVMFSGNGDKENIMRAMKLGAKGFIGKPFSKDKLLQYIQKSPFIQQKNSRRKNHGNHVH